MKVLGVNFLSKEGQVQENVTRAIELIRFWLKKRPVDLVLLPEVFTAAYCGTNLKPYAEPKDGNSVKAFSKLAVELDVVIGFGFVEDSGQDKPYNSYAIIEPGKPVYFYRKTHLHLSQPGSRINEPEFFVPGDTLGLVDTRLGRLGVMICYDGHFAELPRSLVLSGAQVILWPNRCGSYFGECNMVSLRSRDNMVPIICVDGSQTGGDFDLTGYSVITDHKGSILSHYKGSEGLVYAEINPEQAQQDRNSTVDIWAMYQVRRPELYQMITQL
jgi:predicted amidohydrolase